MTAAAPVQVAPGVHRVSVPLPFPPGEVAAWVIEGDEGHTLVDTGIDTPPARDALREAAEHVGVTPESLAFVVLTHAHPDHYGLAEPVRRWSGARVAIHEEEEKLARRFVDRWPEDRLLAGEAFARLGVPERVIPAFLRASDLIHSFYRAFHPDLLLAGARGPLPGGGGWEWIHTPGHSPGHVTVYHPARRILITGDHVLPRISPNVGADLYADEPLSDYLASLAALRGLDVELVLPSHGEPFADLAARIDVLTAHHAERNAQIVRFLAAGPATVFEVAMGVFGDLPPENLLHAVRETLAHLLYLARHARVARAPGDGGVELWARA
ncbi:MAG TPA: MBL fold metallo-hydrolase [Longimicrobiaceae bacterium]|nr:MBL fold metallo-hydrolase [Longimicrobiaceae bacterium]